MPRQHFLAHLMPKIDQNTGNFPYFYKTRDISKSRRVRFLKLGMSVRPEIWTSFSLYMPLKSYRGDFENFDFSAWFAGFYLKKRKFWHKSLQIRLKSCVVVYLYSYYRFNITTVYYQLYISIFKSQVTQFVSKDDF